jgi:hypothetical protein
LLKNAGAERVTHVKTGLDSQFIQDRRDFLKMPSRLGFDQDAQGPDESNAKPIGFDPGQSFVHKQEIGWEFEGQRDRFRLAMIELALKGGRDVGIADVTAPDPGERSND